MDNTLDHGCQSGKSFEIMSLHIYHDKLGAFLSIVGGAHKEKTLIIKNWIIG